MGTSSPSAGPGGNVSFDPPWLDRIPFGGAGESDAAGDDDNATQTSTQNTAAGGLAPPGRFRAARTNLAAFARDGGTGYLRRAAGHYSRTGMGGAKNVAHRMRASTRAAAGLGSFLRAARDQTDPRINEWVDALRATTPTAHSVIDAIVVQIVPEGGSIDEESVRESMAQALSELATLDPEIDLLALGDSQIWTLMQLFLGNEACNRMYADIGKVFENAKFSPAVIVRRTDEMRSFLKNSISAQLDSVRRSSPNPSRRQLESILGNAIQLTFEVFEESL